MSASGAAQLGVGDGDLFIDLQLTSQTRLASQ